jgi:protease-4
VDRLGGLQDAIDCAARLAKVKDYRLREYPEPKDIFEIIMGNIEGNVKAKVLQSEMSPEEWKVYQSIKRVRNAALQPQARIAFDMIIE